MNKIVLEGNPLSTQSIYKFVCNRGYPRLYMTKQGEDLKNIYYLVALSQWKKKVDEGDFEVWIKYYFKTNGRHDIDNFNKILYDSLTGIVWKDDKQIKKDHREILYDKNNPRIELIINKLK